MSDEAERIAHELLDALPVTCSTAELVTLGRPLVACAQPAELIVHFVCPREGHTHQQAICRPHRDKLADGQQRVSCPHCHRAGRGLVPLVAQREEMLRDRPS